MRTTAYLFAAVILATAITSPAFGHFQMIVPSTDIVSSADNKEISIRMMFIHPMEGHSMNMAQPAEFGVLTRGKRQDLLGTLEPMDVSRFAGHANVVITLSIYVSPTAGAMERAEALT